MIYKSTLEKSLPQDIASRLSSEDIERIVRAYDAFETEERRIDDLCDCDFPKQPHSRWCAIFSPQKQ